MYKKSYKLRRFQFPAEIFSRKKDKIIFYYVYCQLVQHSKFSPRITKHIFNKNDTFKIYKNIKLFLFGFSEWFRFE
jgi:hypothetical protein